MSWDREYERGGIPSSYRDQPSDAVKWFADSWSKWQPNWKPQTALDVGCGSGRNSRYLASLGLNVTAFDFSSVAIERCRRHNTKNVAFLIHDLREGFPVDDSSCDVVLDTFVFCHLFTNEERKGYLDELARVLGPKGLFLLTLATEDDGFYGSCTDLKDWQSRSDIRVVVDETADVRKTLFRPDTLNSVMGDRFRLVAQELRHERNEMYGTKYDRETLFSVWSR